MNTYYTIRLRPAQRNALLLAAEYTSEVIAVEPFTFSDEELKLLEPMKAAHELLKNAPQHPNVEDIFMHDAQHGGFTPGEKVLLECTVVATSDHVSTLSIRHLAAVKGEEIMVANNLIYHMEA